MGRKATAVVPTMDGGEAVVATVLDDDETPNAGDLEHLTGAGPEWRWVVYRMLSPAEKVSYPGSVRVMISHETGSIDLTTFQNSYGGGTFEFWGTIEGQPGLKRKITMAFAGPIRPLSKIGEVAPEPTATVVPNGADGVLGPILTRILDRLDRIERGQGQQATPTVQGMSVKDVLELVKMTQAPPAPEPADNQDLLKWGMGMLDRGMEIQAKAEGGAGESTAITVAKLVMPSVEKLLSVITARRAAPPGRPVAATVVETVPNPPTPTATAEPGLPQAEPEPGVMDLGVARWMAIVDTLDRAILRDADPIAFADTLADMLTDDEIEILKLSTTHDIMAELISKASGPYRERLSAPAAGVFMDRVLAELRNPSSEPEDE